MSTATRLQPNGGSDRNMKHRMKWVGPGGRIRNNPPTPTDGPLTRWVGGLQRHGSVHMHGHSKTRSTTTTSHNQTSTMKIFVATVALATSSVSALAPTKNYVPSVIHTKHVVTAEVIGLVPNVAQTTHVKETRRTRACVPS